ncbi:hypothetical protein [Celeribacter marinus]|uniref:hypothetical protein n=1 Tax=Celeribacter marinus TaxID=1397108 RepID=UPI00316E556D
MTLKHTILTATATLTCAALLGFSPAYAIGGNDPINGIDIIIKEDPGSRPIAPFSLSDGELKQINSVENQDRPKMTLSIIAKRIEAGNGFVEAAMKAYSGQGCPPQPWTYCGDPEVFEVGKVTYTLDLNFKGGEVARPTKGSPRIQELPTK